MKTLMKIVKTMVNAGSRLCAFVRWAEFASPLLLVVDSVTVSSEMKGQTMAGLLLVSVSFLCFSVPSVFFVPRLPLSLFPSVALASVCSGGKGWNQSRG